MRPKFVLFFPVAISWPLAYSRYELSPLWPHRIANARHLLRRDPSPAQVTGRGARGNPPANQANLEACIHRALELGISHIGTARGYAMRGRGYCKWIGDPDAGGPLVQNDGPPLIAPS
jgi:hypothetical protein